MEPLLLLEEGMVHVGVTICIKFPAEAAVAKRQQVVALLHAALAIGYIC
jgi:hypothetical protein